MNSTHPQDTHPSTDLQQESKEKVELFFKLLPLAKDEPHEKGDPRPTKVRNRSLAFYPEYQRWAAVHGFQTVTMQMFSKMMKKYAKSLGVRPITDVGNISLYPFKLVKWAIGDFLAQSETLGTTMTQETKVAFVVFPKRAA